MCIRDRAVGARKRQLNVQTARPLLLDVQPYKRHRWVLPAGPSNAPIGEGPQACPARLGDACPV
eukprot:1892002-Alexandrium_andersonii.AAC.1